MLLSIIVIDCLTLAYVWRERDREKERGGEGVIQTDRQMDGDKQTERQTDRQRDRQTDRQTERQTDRQRERERGREGGREGGGSHTVVFSRVVRLELESASSCSSLLLIIRPIKLTRSPAILVL